MALAELIKILGPVLASFIVALIHRWKSKLKIRDLVKQHLEKAGVPGETVDQVIDIIKNEACNEQKEK